MCRRGRAVSVLRRGWAMSDKGKKASHDVAKLQRGATQDQARPQQDAQTKPKVQDAPKAADMPALGGGGDPLAGGLGAAATAAEPIVRLAK